MPCPPAPPARTGALAATALVLLCCLIALPVQALTVPLDDAALAAGADEIVRGRIADVSSQWNAERTQIVTTATVHVTGRAKGQGTGALALAVPGGTVDGVTEWVEDGPVLVDGTEVFVFVKHGPDGNRVHGGAQGLVPVVGGRVPGGREKGGGIGADDYEHYLAALAAGESAVPPAPASTPAARGTASGGPVVLDVSPSSAPAGTGAEITITGTGFGSKADRNSTADVGFYYTRSGSTIVPIWASGYPFPQVRPDDILFWSDTRIVVRVPRGLTEDRFRGSASSGFLWVLDDRDRPSPNAPFGVPFGYGGARWDAGPVPFPVCTDGMTPALIGAVRNASETWNAAVADTLFRLEFTGTTGSRTIGPSMPNLVLMGTPEEFGYGQGTLAYSSVVGGERLSNCVMRINPMYDWAAGDPGPGQVSLEAVALHEFGHWLYLMDLYGDVPGYPRDVGKVMFGYGDPSYTTRPLVDLRAEDVAAIRWIYANGSPPPTPTPVPTPRPYHGPHAVPGTVEAEDYDLGGEGLAYHDATPGNSGGAYRDEGVDLYGANGTVWVAGIQEGEWLAYTLNATAPASVVLRLSASAPAGTWGEVLLFLDDARIGMVGVSPTGAIDAFAVVESKGLWVPAGESVLRLRLPAGIGLESFALVPATPPITPPVKPRPQPYPGPHAVPGTIQAEDYDSGGEGLAYHDAEPANLGGAYRPVEGVDVESGGGVTNIGWVRDGEWLSYTVTPAEPGTVVLRLRASNPDAVEKPLTILRDGLFVATVRVPPTGSFKTWTVANSSPFSIDEEAVLRLASFEGGVERVNLDWLALEPAPVEPARVPGGADIPTDPDSDGVYDDVNGNGRADFADVVLYFDNLDWIAVNEPTALFDCNGNGRIDFADVVWLFDRL